MDVTEEKTINTDEKSANESVEDLREDIVIDTADKSAKESVFDATSEDENNNEEPVIVIEKTNFDQQKEKIKDCAEQKSLSPEFERYQTNDGLFGWFDHNITGREMNEFVEILQKYISGNNEYIKKIIKEFGQVYETFDVLDKEYIHGILTNIKATEKAGKDNTETIRALQSAVKKLKEIKEENKQYHQYIDSISDDIEKLNEFSQALGEYDNKVSELETHNKALTKMLYIAYAIAGSSFIAAIISIVLLISK